MTDARPATPTSPTTPCLVPALLTGTLLWACFFPLAWGFLSWIALVPFLTLTRAQARPRRIYWCAYLCGLSFFVSTLQWMRVADIRMYATWLMLASYCAIYFPLGLWLIRRLDQRTKLPLCLTVPLVWVGLEWIRSFALTGFAWYYLGHAQFRFASLIQIADLGGVYAISFLVAAVNGWLCELAFQIPSLRDRFRWTESTVSHVGQLKGNGSGWGVRPGMWLEAGAIVTVLVAAVLYGTWRLDQTNFAAGPRLALLQGNLDQRIRDESSSPNPVQNMVDTIFLHYTGLCYQASQQAPLADLFVWPETSYFTPFVDISPNLPVEKAPETWLREATLIRKDFRENLAALFPTRHLLGINTRVLNDEGNRTSYSSALFLEKDGSPSRRYDKIHRVPFGEYVPLRDWLPFMNVFSPYDYDFSIAPGQTMTRFSLRDFRFGVLICFEDTDPFLARRYLHDSDDGKPVDFLVNMSNDGWFDGSYEHEEHLIVSRFRAIECRRSLVRSVNMGISAVIDPNGRILKPQLLPPTPPDPRLSAKNREILKSMQIWEVLADGNNVVPELTPSEFGSFKKTSGVLLATVPIDDRVSLYTKWGDWLPAAGWGIIAIALLIARRRLSGSSEPRP